MIFLHRLAPATMEENPLWLVVLCDMMTNLMLFFLVMYVLSQQGPQAQLELLRTFDVKSVIEDPASRASEPPEEFLQAAERLAEALKVPALASAAEVESAEDSIRVRLRDRLLFPTAEARLSPAALPALAVLAAALRDMPNAVIVEGHTDDLRVVSGPYRSNWELSVARSYSVIERLAAEGVAPGRLVAAGYGEHHPIADNGSEEGRSRNRRVELVILREADE